MKRAVLVVLVLLVAGGLAAVFFAPTREESAAATPTSRANSAASDERAAAIDVLAPARVQTEATTRAVESTSSAATATGAPPDRAAYRVEFTNADSGEPLRECVEVIASIEGERVTPRFDSKAGAFEFYGLRSGVWRIEARAQGFQDFATNVQIDEREASGERFKLWPLNWIVVRVRSSEGGGIDELAQRLGMETADVFEGGFRVWRSSEPPADELAPPTTPPQGPEQGVELASPHYERQRRDSREVARVRRARQGSTWIALAFHGRFVGWGQALASDGALEFELALEDITAQFGALALCVVDEASGAPLSQLQVRLMAETSGLRRADIDKPAPDARGCVNVKPLVPDEYDLFIEAPGYAAHHQRIAVAPGQRVDLGAIALRLAPPLEISVLDATGAPLRALVQVGAWREGAWLDDCITPNASTTDDSGRTTIPRPGVKSVLCARRLEFGPDRRPTVSPTPCALAAFDPASSPDTLQLVLPQEFEVELALSGEYESAATLIIVHSSGVAIARSSRWTQSMRFELPEGEFQARVLDAFGAELARYSFRVPRGGSGRPIRLE